MENMVVKEAKSGFWLDRPVFVTGGTGLVGSWLVRRLVEARADVVCLVRDWVPQSELVRSRRIEQVKVVRGDVRDGETLERALGEYEIDTSQPRRSFRSPIAIRSRPLKPTSRAPGICWKPAAAVRG
jgi:CDP-glucose 4,6-dehydratase